MGEYMGVTVETGKSYFRDMLLMIVCNRLGNTFGIGTTIYKYQHNDGNNENPEIFHLSSEFYGAVLFPFQGENDLPVALISPEMSFFTSSGMELSRSISRKRLVAGNEMGSQGEKRPPSLSGLDDRNI